MLNKTVAYLEAELTALNIARALEYTNSAHGRMLARRYDATEELLKDLKQYQKGK